MMKNENAVYGISLNIAILTVAVILSIILIADYRETLKNTVDTQPTPYFRTVDPRVDLIYGNPNADIFIVEYGDLECPYCKEFHPNIKRTIEGPQGVAGRVAWVWRNGFHINETSLEKAETLECVRRYLGNEERTKVWQFIEGSLFGGVLENEYPYERYKQLIESLGLPFEEIDACKKEDLVHDVLEENLVDILNLNITDTPLLQFISNSGELLFQTTGALSTIELETLLQRILIDPSIQLQR